MRHSAAEKREIIGRVEGSELSVRRTLAELDIPRSTFYGGYRRYVQDGLEGLSDRRPNPGVCWNRTPESVREDVVETPFASGQIAPGTCLADDRHAGLLYLRVERVSDIEAL